MSFLVNCRRIINGSSLITSRNNSTQIRTKHSISRATQTVSKENPLRQFVAGKGKSAGRNSKGRITIFHRGGRAKQSQRTIDLKRNTSSVGIVERIEYDPNRTSRIAVLRWEGEGKRKDVDPQNKFHVDDQTDRPFVTTKFGIPMKGQFSFSSMPGMVESRKAVSSGPKTRHAVVGLSNGVNPYFSKATDEGTRPTNVRDVFLSAFSSLEDCTDGPRCYFHSELVVPRMALAGSRPDFFVPGYKDLYPVLIDEGLVVNEEVKNWRKDSPVWDHKMKRKAALSWQNVRRQETHLGFHRVSGEKYKKLKAVYKTMYKQRSNENFTANRAPVTYILATNQMKSGQVVMNCDSSKRSKDELLNRY